MKKIFFLIIIILMTYYLISIFISKNNIKIPNESIRIRVIANSNLEEDQKIKKIVSNNLMVYLNNQLENVKNIEEAREKISSLISNLNLIVNMVLKKYNVNQTFKLNYGYNYFPEKKFKDNKYKEGYYESILVTLGEGLGDNFWCLLFPPLCLLDKDEDNIEYASFINEIFNL